MAAHSFDSANIDPSIPPNAVNGCTPAPRFHRSRSIDRSIPVRQRRERERERRGGQFAGSLGACSRTPPPQEEEEEEDWPSEEERARKKSIVNWDQDVTPRARGRIRTWRGSYTYPTGTRDGCLLRITRAHTYVSAAATGNNKRRAILINYLYR